MSKYFDYKGWYPGHETPHTGDVTSCFVHVEGQSVSNDESSLNFYVDVFMYNNLDINHDTLLKYLCKV